MRFRQVSGALQPVCRWKLQGAGWMDQATNQGPDSARDEATQFPLSTKEIVMKTRRFTVLPFALFVLFGPMSASAQQAQQPAWDCPGPWHMWGGSWGFWWMFPAIMLFMMVAIAVMFFLGRRSGGGHPHWGPWQMMDRSRGADRSWGDPTYSALQILNERLAKGEIQKQEYEEKKITILSGRQQ